MGDSKDESTAQALTRLASAYEHLADDMAEMAGQMKKMNGSVQDHTTRLALGSQWVKNHVGHNSVHANMDKRLNVMWKLLWVAIGLPTILVVAASIQGFLR